MIDTTQKCPVLQFSSAPQWRINLCLFYARSSFHTSEGGEDFPSPLLKFKRQASLSSLSLCHLFQGSYIAGVTIERIGE